MTEPLEPKDLTPAERAAAIQAMQQALDLLDNNAE